MYLDEYEHVESTWKVLRASSVLSGASLKSCTGPAITLWDELRASLGGCPGSIFKVTSPPTTSSCFVRWSSGPWIEDIRLVGDCVTDSILTSLGVEPWLSPDSSLQPFDSDLPHFAWLSPFSRRMSSTPASIMPSFFSLRRSDIRVWEEGGTRVRDWGSRSGMRGSLRVATIRVHGLLQTHSSMSIMASIASRRRRSLEESCGEGRGCVMPP